jgi:hypothetical protein
MVFWSSSGQADIPFQNKKNSRAFESKFGCYENPIMLQNTTGIGTLF